MTRRLHPGLRRSWLARGLIAWLLLGTAVADSLTFRTQRRDPATGAVITTPLVVDPARVGIVIVDMWNWHWCKTATARVAAMVPRMQESVRLARDAGMTVFWCPSDVADNYVGTRPYERAFATARIPVPPLAPLECPSPDDGGGCTCGTERCVGNYGWDGMHPDLVLHEEDFMPNDLETLYSIARERGLTHLIYLGVHTQVCLLGKSIGLRNLTRAGFQCVLARDLTDAHAKYDPAAGITPDSFTRDVVAHFEKYLSPTINLGEEWQRAGRWNSDTQTDRVRFAPWGTVERPHFLRQTERVTLSLPLVEGGVVRYTVDGSNPGPQSPTFDGQPIALERTTRLRAAGFVGDRQVTPVSEALFARLPAPPPRPDILLSELKPVRIAGPGHAPSSADHYFTGATRPPQVDRNNRGEPLRIRREVFAQGWGVHAPNQIVYALAPEWERFVARAGADDQLHDDRHGANRARYPSVVFRVVVDGVVLAESPTLRPGEPAWGFDVALPAGARQLSLVTMDAGDGNREDLANWVSAGFLRRRR